MKNIHLSNRIIWSAEHVPQGVLQSFVVFYLVWNLFENIYNTVTAAQGLTTFQ